MEADGTISGLVENLESYGASVIELQLEQLMTSISYYWLGPWPRLVASFTGGLSSDTLTVDISVDLLGSVQIASFDYETSADDHLTETQLVALQSQIPGPVDFLGGPLGIWCALLSTMWTTIDLLVIFSFVPMTTAGLASVISSFLIMWGAWLLAIEVGVSNGYVSALEACSLTLSFAFGLALETAIYAMICAAAVLTVKAKMVKASSFLGKMADVAEHWGVISFAVKLAILISTLLLYGRYYGMLVEEYTASIT